MMTSTLLPLAAPRERRSRLYRVKKIWRTVQGEGLWTGRAAVFVRLSGCNMWSGEEADRQRDAARTGAMCPLWCDTDFRKEGSVAMTADEVVLEAVRHGAAETDFVVISGGEPLLQVDADLIQAFHIRGIYVAVETNGTVSLYDHGRFHSESYQRVIMPDWIVCSPKLPQDQIVLERMDELKLVVPDYTPDLYSAIVPRVRKSPVGNDYRRLLWLQPEDGPRYDEAVKRCLQLVQADPEWRINVQAHKIIGAE